LIKESKKVLKERGMKERIRKERGMKERGRKERGMKESLEWFIHDRKSHT
jgi:hypothetical protein